MTERAGGCVCGAVRYVVTGPLREIVVCHCLECRRWAGRAWGATATRREDLTLRCEDTLRWEPSPASETQARRGFCAACGSSLFWEAPGRATVSIGAGTLDDATGLEVAAHIWVEQAQEWDPPGEPAFPRGYPSAAAPPAWR